MVKSFFTLSLVILFLSGITFSTLAHPSQEGIDEVENKSTHVQLWLDCGEGNDACLFALIQGAEGMIWWPVQFGQVTTIICTC